MTIPRTDPTSDPASGAAAGAAEPAPGRVREPAAAASAASPGQSARRLALHFGVVLLGASGLASWVGGARAGLSAALGVALAGANLLLMQKITLAMTTGSDVHGNGTSGNAAWGLALPFKLVVLVGVAYALVSTGVAQPVPLAMGFAILPLSGVFLPRPTSVPRLAPRPRAQPASSHPSRRQPAA